MAAIVHVALRAIRRMASALVGRQPRFVAAVDAQGGHPEQRNPESKDGLLPPNRAAAGKDE